MGLYQYKDFSTLAELRDFLNELPQRDLDVVWFPGTMRINLRQETLSDGSVVDNAEIDVNPLFQVRIESDGVASRDGFMSEFEYSEAVYQGAIDDKFTIFRDGNPYSQYGCREV